MNKQITIFTPTYNRAYCLHRCYESLKRQTCKEFVWLVVDDGSTDNTSDIVRTWKEQTNDFEIIYVRKGNGGMHTAHNTAYDLITTELNICVDSDDYLTDNAIELILKLWNSISETDDYAGIVALNVYNDGKVIGNRLPDEKTIRLYEYYRHGGRGDKKLIYRTDIIRKYPQYPVFPNEKLVPLGTKYMMIDQDFELLVLNMPVCVVEYMSDGSTKNIFRQYVINPNGFAYARIVHMKYGKGIFYIFKEAIHYVSSCIQARKKGFLRESPKKIMTLLATPFGLFLWLLVRHKC